MGPGLSRPRGRVSWASRPGSNAGPSSNRALFPRFRVKSVGLAKILEVSDTGRRAGEKAPAFACELPHTPAEVLAVTRDGGCATCETGLAQRHSEFGLNRAFEPIGKALQPSARLARELRLRSSEMPFDRCIGAISLARCAFPPRRRPVAEEGRRRVVAAVSATAERSRESPTMRESLPADRGGVRPGQS